MDILRIHTDSLERDLVGTVPVPLAKDNLVCAICDARLGEHDWTTVSHPKRKGVVVFACRECVNRAMALLSKLL